MSAYRPADLPRDVYTVSRLNREAHALLEGSFPLLWIEGEVSGLSRPASGHWYFTLKDPMAQVRCAMFRTRNRALRFTPEDGMHVLLRARVSLYEGRGEFQLIVEHLEPAGDGALLRAFEELKQRLAMAGLFDAAHKRPLPSLPTRIGVITSPSGAALHDVLTVLKRRFPLIPVLIYAVPVQGAEAPRRIAQALALASRRGDCDVLLVTRGGGSLEDLQAYNTEVVARAIFECPIPVVSAVGHEIDFTIADLVADCRAATPSAAAELVSPDRQVWQQHLASVERRLRQGLEQRLARSGTQLAQLERRLQHPGRRLMSHAQRLDELEQRLRRARDNLQHRRLSQLQALQAGLARHSPLRRLANLEARRDRLSVRLNGSIQRLLEKHRRRLERGAATLHAVSPLATLQRGYAILTRIPHGEIVRSAAQVAQGDRVKARLAEGRLLCRVDESTMD